MSDSTNNQIENERNDKLNEPDELPASFEQRSQRLFEVLANLGIEKVFVGFDGFNGGGRITFVTKEAIDKRATQSLKDIDCGGKPLHSTIGDFFYDLLKVQHKGWKDDLGSFGLYIMDVSRREITEEIDERDSSFWRDEAETDEVAYKRLIEALFTRLADLGVNKILVKCEGGGDSGEVVSAEPTMLDGGKAPLLNETNFEGRPLLDAVEEVVLKKLFGDHPGWELDWGSDATYVLNVPRRKLSCKFFQPCPENDSDDEEDAKEEDEDSIEE